MKTQIKKELHSKTISELRKQLIEARDEQRVLKLDRELGKIKNTSSLTTKRVEIAVISTILNEKLIAEKLAAKLDEGKEVPVTVKPVIKKQKIEKIAKAEGKKPASAKAIAGKGGKNE